jgi:predicted nucleotidyltransferase
VSTVDAKEAAIRQEIVRRIVATVDPDRIVLFGSRARGDAGPHSDYDLLVVALCEQSRLRRALPLYRALAGLRIPKDVLWWTPREIDEWRSVRSHFVTTALREGEVLYERPA